MIDGAPFAVDDTCVVHGQRRGLREDRMSGLLSIFPDLLVLGARLSLSSSISLWAANLPVLPSHLRILLPCYVRWSVDWMASGPFHGLTRPAAVDLDAGMLYCFSTTTETGMKILAMNCSASFLMNLLNQCNSQ